MFVKIIPPTLNGGNYHKGLHCETGLGLSASVSFRPRRIIVPPAA
jgi:hypothetical protein